MPAPRLDATPDLAVRAFASTEPGAWNEPPFDALPLDARAASCARFVAERVGIREVRVRSLTASQPARSYELSGKSPGESPWSMDVRIDTRNGQITGVAAGRR